MLKKWKKTIKLLGTTTIVLIYLTIGLFNDEALKGEEKNKKSLALAFEGPLTTEKYLGSVKTIIGYSKKFRIKQELEDRIECEAGGAPGGAQRGKWTEEKKLGIKIFSAYYDQRQDPYHYIRIIGLLRRNSSFYCQIWYENKESTTYITQRAMVHEIWSKDWGPKNRTCEDDLPAIISCLAPPQNGTLVPSWVSFVDNTCRGGETFIRVKEPPRALLSKRKDFVICVKPTRLENIHRESLLEWMEINSRLGAEEIVFYVHDEKKTDSAFGNYTRGRLLVRREFETPSPGSCPPRTLEESIWHKRKMEIIAYNDCFYSNLHQTKFVIPLDVDEIIVPKTGNNWFEAFRSHFLNAKLPEETKNPWPEDTENYASFSVRNAYFFPLYPKDAIIRSLMLPKRDQNVPKKLVKASPRTRGRIPPGETIFDRTLRSFLLSPKSDSVKSFVHVAKTLSIFNHYAFHVLGDAARQLIFPESVFQLNHYRNSCDSLLIDGCREFLNQVVYDDSLERFRKKRKPSL